MSSMLQEGIYYRAKPPIGNSFCIVSLQAVNNANISEIRRTIMGIWNHLSHLKKGITVDLKIDSKHRKVGDLTVLFGFSSKFFELSGLKKQRPAGFSSSWNFLNPESSGGGPIFHGSGMNYSPYVTENHLSNDHIIIQLIAENEFYTKRAAVEIWKGMRKLEKETGKAFLQISGLYTGFQRADKRSWLGFHDGVSNLKSRERPYVISLGPRSVNSSDKWTINGTYLAFMRISLDLEKWENTPAASQQIAIGRDKLSGCPLIRVDKTKTPIKDPRCPVPGTSEIIDPGNEVFRDHPPYGNRIEDKILQFSHIGSTRPIDHIAPWDKKSMRIYRQGFEFLVASKDPAGFSVGLNFVSFQNTPEKLFRSLVYRNTIAKKNSEVTSTLSLEKYMSVSAAGIFFVPPSTKNELFPGSKIFV
jgi:Dyp-type peroxidase family